MQSLNQDAIDSLSSCPEKGYRIVSCGIVDECLRIVTGSGSVREISKNGILTPLFAIPLREGRIVSLDIEGRGTKNVSSNIIIKHSKNCLNKPELFVNNSYVCDVEIDGFEFPAGAQ